jgi:hypothetical protein
MFACNHVETIPGYQNIATTLLRIVIYDPRLVSDVDSLPPFNINIWVFRRDVVHDKSLT